LPHSVYRQIAHTAAILSRSKKQRFLSKTQWSGKRLCILAVLGFTIASFLTLVGANMLPGKLSWLLDWSGVYIN